MLVAAAEEERFRRVKHWAGFPAQAIGYCLREAGVDLSDVDHVAVNQDSRANLIRKLGYLLSHRPDPQLVYARWRNRRSRAGIPELLTTAFPGQGFRAALHRIEHHLAHLSSAFHVSPVRRGGGRLGRRLWRFLERGLGHRHRAARSTIHGRVYFPHSLGIFYQALTQYLGFPHYGDEYKVMGLAPYGKAAYLDAMRKIVHLLPDGSFSARPLLFSPPSITDVVPMD